MASVQQWSGPLGIVAGLIFLVYGGLALGWPPALLLNPYLLFGGSALLLPAIVTLYARNTATPSWQMPLAVFLVIGTLIAGLQSVVPIALIGQATRQRQIGTAFLL